MELRNVEDWGLCRTVGWRNEEDSEGMIVWGSVQRPVLWVSLLVCARPGRAGSLMLYADVYVGV